MSSVLLAVAELLHEQDCNSYTLSATDAGYWTERSQAEVKDGRPRVNVTIIGRTAFEAFCVAVGVTATERVVIAGQRAWYAERDTKTGRLLIEGVSFQHHDDWQPRPT